MPIEHKAHRPSSRLLAHLNWLLDEALEQTFPASDPVAILSIVDHTIVRPEFSIPALRSLASGRWARGLHRNTNAYRAAIEFVLTAGAAKQTNCSLTYVLRHSGPHRGCSNYETPFRESDA